MKAYWSRGATGPTEVPIACQQSSRCEAVISQAEAGNFALRRLVSILRGSGGGLECNGSNIVVSEGTRADG
jgi:hypothetical protein